MVYENTDPRVLERHSSSPKMSLENQEMIIFRFLELQILHSSSKKSIKKIKKESGSYKSFFPLYAYLGLSPSTRSFCLVYQRKHRKDNSSTLPFDGPEELALRNLGPIMPTLSRPDSRSRTQHMVSCPVPGRETIYWDSLPDYFFFFFKTELMHVGMAHIL